MKPTQCRVLPDPPAAETALPAYSAASPDRGSPFQPVTSAYRKVRDWLDSRFGQRAAGMLLALLCEALLALLLLSLAAPQFHHKAKEAPVLSFYTPKQAPTPSEAEQTPKTGRQEKPKPVQHQPQTTPQPAPTPPKPAPKPEQTPKPLPFIQLSTDQMASTDITNARPVKHAPPAKPSGGTYGPVADPLLASASDSGDSKRVGTAPNGAPLYAARWYREPTNEELAGYLSTARGPGWGLIACKTAPNYRVEDCVKVDEYPEGSGLARAVLAASWQFRVRPPQIGGVPQIGDWVRIEIDYERKEVRSYGK
ncbi:protein TonB [Stakelama sediminis]|uniref:Protein TonB n=1 Tax=Stakelama sediminis TaxID=463200 RepID=A0A840YV19_9SPHN|nr:hypothetical protein [Stakelama sediminis]MBB5717531.1 protein TonB [Stakelama sediminis]